jgi:hypothetical protein
MALKVKPFYLYRHEDLNGLSGTGVVAVGCQFPNGRIVFQWVTYRSSMEIYDSLENLIEIHGHEGKTEVVFGECPTDKTETKTKKTKKKTQS